MKETKQNILKRFVEDDNNPKTFKTEVGKVTSKKKRDCKVWDTSSSFIRGYFFILAVINSECCVYLDWHKVIIYLQYLLSVCRSMGNHLSIDQT